MDILLYPEPSLTDPARPVERVDDRVRATAQAMVETMYAARGIGLAGPQVGFPFRLVTINLTGKPEDLRVYVNLEIRSATGDEVSDEGCLSFPGLSARVHRAQAVVFVAAGLDGQEIEQAADGLLARALQHEVDHLDGILLVNRLRPAERARHSGFLKEMERGVASGRRPGPAGAAGRSPGPSRRR